MRMHIDKLVRSSRVDANRNRDREERKKKEDIFISMAKSPDIETDNETDQLALRQLSRLIVNKNSHKINGDRRTNKK